MNKIENKYVAFCDILGFSNSVLTEFNETLELYQEFKKEIGNDLFPNLEISLYSDSVLVIGSDLLEVCKAVQILLWTGLRYDWLMRGGIAFGKHWKEKDEQNLFIVSEALVKAVSQEKSIKSPVIVISDEIILGEEYWIHLFANPVFAVPIIHFDGKNIINPFNFYWFASAETRLLNLKSKHPAHSDKYDYLINLSLAIKNDYSFVPKQVTENLIKKGFIKEII